MEEYLREQRRVFGQNFSAACEQCCPAAAAQSTETQPISPGSTLSSVNSQDVGDFISEFRCAFSSLRPRKGKGLLTKDDMGEVLYFLDMDASEELLKELFSEIDVERRGAVDLETFLAAVGRKLSSDGLRASTPATRVTPPGSAASSKRSNLSGNTSGQSFVAAESSSVGCPHGSGATQRAPTPCNIQEKRPGSDSSTKSLAHRECARAKLNSSSGRKPAKNQPMVLWWGFQDLADTL